MSQPQPDAGPAPAPGPAPVTLEGLIGRLERTAVTLPDGSADTTARVSWLQGPGRHVDLRQPPGRPSFAGVRGPGDLQEHHARWLARQEGFAGRTVLDGELCAWHRLVDLLPPAPSPDEGWLRWHGPLLLEQGRHAPYVERWEPAPGPRHPAAEAELAAPGTVGVLVRVGEEFGYARRGTTGSEVCLGRVDGPRWTVERSSSPWHEGADLSPCRSGGALLVRDPAAAPDAAAGAPGGHGWSRWSVTASRGSQEDLVAG